ncbi:MAG: Protein phosphatase 2C [Phormidesmis priestleyi Ana]|uniref:Protein phosphatase 2C n=1 Tax=Phormidesmis priestleyi Ana TaxID=1666911 RepID=A0A0P7ZFL1_9CYAN|nr:MAG: Protein phosphatase 2C [Phormidesmis priestleyi Ana]
MTHKDNEKDSDCQDYCRIENNCCAIADGASQSFYPSLWAKLLVDNFCEHPNINEKNWEIWLRDIQSDWLLMVTGKVKLLRDKKTSSWITNQNRLTSREPATSTFVGLNFEFSNNQLKVAIVGDSCLFILENGELKKSYLLNYSDEFSDRPRYLASYQKNNDFSPDFLTIGIEENIEVESDNSLYFILATDALSEYIFNSREQSIDVFKGLLEISSKEEFDFFVSQARTQKNPRLKNDDTSLVVLKCENGVAT